HLQFVWIAPEQSRFGTEQVITPIHGRLDVGQLGKQARLELTGTPPFRSNFVSILDFQTVFFLIFIVIVWVVFCGLLLRIITH
uniref:Neur_chan_LBD domain-containing protein n=1 Tax=Meloidogyne hapla TaxID=6305 RepID=A0A1I8B8L4_MELHA